MYTCVCMVSHFSHVWLLVTLWTVAHQAPLSMGFPGKNTGVGCHALLYRIFLTQESNGCLLCLLHWQVGSLTLALPGKHVDLYNRRFTVEIDSHEHKGFKKLHCLLTASWKIRTTWNNSVWVRRPENQELQHWRAGGPGYPSSKK